MFGLGGTVFGGVLAATIAIDDAGFGRSMARIIRNFNSGRRAAISMVGAVGLVVAAVGLVGGVSVAAFSAFDKEIRQAATLVDGGRRRIEEFQQSILDLSNSMGFDAVKSARSFYEVISAGIDDPVKALAIVNQSIKNAIGGVAELEVATKGLTTIMNAWGLGMEDITRISDEMFQVVNLGVLRFDELASAIGIVAPIAVAAGVDFADLGAAIATITQSGLSAAQAATFVRSAIIGLQRGNLKAVDAIFEKLGVTSVPNLIDKFGNLPSAFKAVIDAAEELGLGGDRLIKVFGRIEGTQGALILGQSRFEDAMRVFGEVATNSAGRAQNAFEIMEESISRRFERIRVKINNVLIELGRGLAPAVEEFTDIAEALVPALNQIAVALTSIIKLGGDTVGVISNIVEEAKKIPGLEQVVKLVNPFDRPDLGALFGSKGDRQKFAEEIAEDFAIDDPSKLIDPGGDPFATLRDVGARRRSVSSFLKDFADINAATKGTRDLFKKLTEAGLTEAAAMQVVSGAQRELTTALITGNTATERGEQLAKLLGVNIEDMDERMEAARGKLEDFTGSWEELSVQIIGTPSRLAVVRQAFGDIAVVAGENQRILDEMGLSYGRLTDLLQIVKVDALGFFAAMEEQKKLDALIPFYDDMIVKLRETGVITGNMTVPLGATVQTFEELFDIAMTFANMGSPAYVNALLAIQGALNGTAQAARDAATALNLQLGREVDINQFRAGIPDIGGLREIFFNQPGADEAGFAAALAADADKVASKLGAIEDPANRAAGGVSNLADQIQRATASMQDFVDVRRQSFNQTLAEIVGAGGTGLSGLRGVQRGINPEQDTLAINEQRPSQTSFFAPVTIVNPSPSGDLNNLDLAIAGMGNG